MNKKIGNKGVFSLEYAVLIIILVVTLCIMFSYIQRAISGRFRESGDVFGYGRQYTK